MINDKKTLEFVSENLPLYREVTVAVRQFEQQIEAILRSVVEDHQADLTALGLSMQGATVKPSSNELISEVILRKAAQQVELGVALQASEASDYSYCAYSFIGIKDKVLRSIVDEYLRKSTSNPFEYEFQYQTSYISLYGESGKQETVVSGLAGTFGALLRSIGDLPDFRSSIRQA